MQAFVRAFHGVESMLSPQERALLGRVVANVAAVVSTAGEGGESSGPGAASRSAGRAQGRPSDTSSADSDVLAALDFDPFAHGDEAPTDPALARLVPLASRGDEDVAREFRRLTQGDLRQEKATRLLVLWEELEAPTGRDGAVRIPDGDEGLWLAALTDLRLFLSVRLGIETAQDVEQVDALVLGEAQVAHDDERGRAKMLAAGVYTALGWWQESLLSALGA